MPVEEPRRVPATVDDATDPSTPSGIPTPRHVLAAPALGPASYSTPPAGSLAVPPVGTAAPSAPRSHAASATMLGHAVSMGGATGAGSKTLMDPTPFRGDADTEIPETSRRPTPVVPPPSTLESTSVSDPKLTRIVQEEVARAKAAADTDRGKFNQTMLLGGDSAFSTAPEPSVARPGTPPAPAAAPAPKPAFQSHTMLGMPSVIPAAVPGSAVPQPRPVPGLSPQASHPQHPAQPSPQALPPVMKTMIGVAIPGIAPTREPPNNDRGHIAGTLLGIAAPGIAPSNPGARHGHGPAQSPASAPMPPPPPVLPAPAPLQHEPLPQAPRAPVAKGIPAIAVVGIVAVVVLVAGGVAAAFALRSGPSLTAQPQLDEAGKESLKIHCETCADGTTVTLGASTATVAAKNAILALPVPLKIGDNELAMKVDRPASGRDETVKVHVPVAYRVKADLTTLSSQPPAVTVRVEAAPGASVTVDGKPLALDGSGQAAYAIDVTAEVEGPSDEQKTIDRKIPFTVKAAKKDAPVENGQLVVRASVVPLHLDAPGVTLFTDRSSVAVAGQTKPGGTLTVDGQGVAVDAQGRFAIRVENPVEGVKTMAIVANAPPLAPRSVKATITHVASLEAAAPGLDAKGPLTFDAFGAEPAKSTGRLVVVDGEVVDARIAQGHTTLIVEEKKTCTTGSCIVRIVHGDESKAIRGDGVRIYGRLLGVVSNGGKTIPDIEGALVVVRPVAKK